MPAISMIEYAATTDEPMRRGLIQNIIGNSVFFRILRFIPVTGFSYEYGEQTKLPAIVFRAINQGYDADAGVINPKVETLRVFGGIVQMDHQFVGSDLQVNAVLAKTKAAGIFYDWNVLNGDPNNNPKAFPGLKQRLIGKQVLYAATNGGQLTLDLLDQLLDLVPGPNKSKVLLMSKYQRRKLKALLVAAAGGASVADTGSTVASYDGAPIEVMDEDDAENPILPQTETRGTSNVTGSIYCIRPGQDPAGEFVQGLVRGKVVEHTPLAQTNVQVGDLIEMVGGLGIFHGRAGARLAGLL